MTRRCTICGVGTVTGDDVRRCDSCAFDYCNDHAATVGGVTTCQDCATLDARAVRAEFARRVAARNPGRALPDRLRIDARPMRPVLVGAGIAVVVLAVGWFFPWRHFVDLSLLAVGIGSVAWRPTR